jgi:hypothetical protein
MELKLPQTSETDQMLNEAGIEPLTYDTRWRTYRIRIDADLDETQRAMLLKLTRTAKENFGSPA